MIHPTRPVIHVEAEAVRAHRIPVWSAVEPDDDPQVQLTRAVAADPEPGGWTQVGEWGSEWDERTGLVDLVTPLIGPGQALTVPDGGTRAVWARWVAGDETYVVKVAWLHAT